MLKVLVIMLTGSLVAGRLCPEFTTTGDPRFTRRPMREDSVRLGTSQPLVCCGAGVDDITWLRHEGTTWRNYTNPDDGSASPEEHGQVLRIHSAEPRDNTTFKCQLVKNGEVVTSNEIRLYLIICDHLAQGPKLTDPFPVSQSVDTLGGDVTFACTGYFGCLDGANDLGRIVEWQVKGSWGNISKVDKRYTTKTHNFFGGVTIQSNLTIKSVSKEDLERTFRCQLASPQVIKGQTYVDVQVSKTKKPNLELLIIICLASLGVVAMAIVISCLIYHCYGPQIRVCLESRLKIMTHKTISGEGLEQNAFIYHAQDDARLAHEIKTQLKESGFVTKTSDDIPPNRFELGAVEEEIEKSAMVLFIYSDNLREDKLANIVVQSLVYDSQEKSLVFIEIDNYDPQEAMAWTIEAKNETKPKIGDNSDGELQADGEGDAEDPGKNSIDLKFWKVLPRLKFPKDKASDRQKKNFWCSLQTKIPRFKGHVEVEKKKSNSSMERNSKGRSSSSTKPLLESPVPSPAYVDNTVFGENMSPSSVDSGNKFRYDKPVHGSVPAERRYSDDSVTDKNTAVKVNADVHQPDESGTNAATAVESEVNVRPELEPSVREHRVVIDEERAGEDEEPAEIDNHETCVFTLSNEESHPVCNGTENRIANSELDKANNDQDLTCTNSDSNLPNAYKGQVGSLAVKINGDRSKVFSTSTSQESGYTSMSPERQVDVEPNFMMQSNVNNEINV